MHRRTFYRELIHKKLKETGLFPMDIYNGRRDPTSVPRLPAIFIISLDESVERRCEAPVILRKSYHVGIEVLVSHALSIDNALDKVTGNIEACLLADDGHFLGSDVYWFHHESTDFNWSAKGEEILGHARMTFRIIYDTTPATEEETQKIESVELNYVQF